MLLAFFGGAFNPPHMGHYLAASYYLALEPKGALWLMPSAKHPYGKEMAPFSDRVRWCKMMAKSLGTRVSVSTLERRLPGERAYTYLLALALKKKHPRAHLRMLVGADAYADRANWYEADALAKLVEFFPIGRGTRHESPGLPYISLPIPEVSSTEIRARLSRGESCRGLVPDAILTDVAKHCAFSKPSPRKRDKKA
jgi:nicotinate-nucleotide adenylyltransferase